jgi:hypothetical protein
METLEQPARKVRRSFPELVYERWGGKTYYRKGYRDVLKGIKTPAEIMGASGLQSFIVSYINGHLHGLINRKLFRMLTNEPGLHIGHRENLACDVMVYDRDVLTNDKITVKYVDVPPLVSIEVDVKVELDKESDLTYVFTKTQQLFVFGAQSVIWVLSDIRQVLICKSGTSAVIYQPWNSEVEVTEGVFFNVGAYLEEEGIIL